VVALDEVFRGGDRSDRSTLGETLPDSTAGPMDTFEVKETKEALIKAVSQMAEREKTVLTLYYYEGLTLAEIGDILGVTESRVCQIHTKAVLQLRASWPTDPRRRAAAQRPRRPSPARDGDRLDGLEAGAHLGHGLTPPPPARRLRVERRGRGTTMVVPHRPVGCTCGIYHAPDRVHGRPVAGVLWSG